MNSYHLGFEDDDRLRSDFTRGLTLQQLERSTASAGCVPDDSAIIPKVLIQYWHDSRDVPEDVRGCLNSWGRLAEAGVAFRRFDDFSATAYILERYGPEESQAFARCRHPAMRSDYLRMSFLLAEGGLYVDADDALVGDSLDSIFKDGRLKVQPLCYDIPSASMILPREIWQSDLVTEERIFYVNNNPIAAPAGHPILRRALARATDRLLGADPRPEIQSTTGPGNFTAALVAHARELMLAGASLDFELLRGWENIAETRWDLSYRGDSRNWRSMDVG